MKHPKAVGTFAVILGLVVIGASIYWHQVYAPIGFDQNLWLHGETIASNPRLRMADGLVRSEVLLGKSGSEVQAMLGPPTSTDKFRGVGLVYWLGPERNFISIDSEWLTIAFSPADKVDDARIVTD